MPNFQYQAKDPSGKIQKGEIEATSLADAAKILRGRKLLVLTLEGQKTIPGLGFLKRGVPAKDKIMFTRELAIMIKAGLPVASALDNLEEQTSHKLLKKIAAEISTDIKGGQSLSQAFAKHPTTFPPLYLAVARSGEKSGQLDEMFDSLADQMEKDYELASKVKGAMMYPAVILVALVGVLTLIVLFVLPQLKTVFEESGATLPLATRLLLSGSIFLRRFAIFIFIIIVGVIIGLLRYIKSPSGSLLWDRIKIRLPIFGNLFRKIAYVRLARTFATLIKAGLPILEIIKTAQDVVSNKVYAAELTMVAKEVERGVSISAAFKKSQHFPAMFSGLVAIGEQAGNIDYVMTCLADFFDKEVETSTDSLATLIEPILMIVMAVGVGLIAVAVIGPIYSLVNTV